MATLNHYIILWKRHAAQKFAAEADIWATGPEAAVKQFKEMWPNDIVLEVRSGRTKDGWY